MTSDAAAETSPNPQPTPAGPRASPAFPLAHAQVRLAAASRALWAATLSLMAAFMQTPAPAHRYLLAGRIARNFEILSGQDCFDGGCRDSFARLARRWKGRAEQFSPNPRRRSLLDFLF